MRTFYFLSNLCKSIMKTCSVVAILLTVGVGEMWGTTITNAVYTFGSSSTPTGWSVSSSNTHASGYLKMSANDYVQMTTASIFKSGEVLSSNNMKVEVSCGTFGTWSNPKSIVCTVELRSSSNSVLSTANATFSGLDNSETTYRTAITVAKPSDPSQIAYLRITFSSFTTGTTLRVKNVRLNYSTAAAATIVTPSPTSITFDTDQLDGNGEASGSTTLDLSVSNGYKSSGNYLYLYVVSDDTECEFTVNSGAYDYSSGNSTSIDDLSVEYYAIDAGTWTGRIIASGYNSSYVAVNCTISLSVTITASCATNPTAGSSRLNGPFKITSTTGNIGVATSGWTVGSNCAWTDYGFVWSLKSNNSSPTVGGSSCNKVPVDDEGTVTNWTGNLTPSGSTTPTSWTTGNTYCIKAYGKNGYASGSYQYTSVYEFTPQSIVYKDGASTLATHYVPKDSIVPAGNRLANPTKTGYTFSKWCAKSDLSVDFSWSNAITKDTVIYAKWNANGYTISLDNQTPTTASTPTSISVTYNASTNLTGTVITTLPTKTGYNFGGYYTSTGGGGSQIIDADGVVVASVASYTGASKEWIYAGNKTIYAKWTIKNYTVTWKVNNTNYTTGGPTDNVNHGSSVSKLPTAPDPGDYCGDKFVGWTDADGGVYVNGTSNLYTKASDFPNATGNQIFYAVFADYDE